MEKKTMGAFIAVLRKASGLTQQDLADKLNVSNKTVSKWECDETYPDISLIPVLAEIFDVTCDELLKGSRILDSDENQKDKKDDKKTDRQLKRIVNNSVFVFKNLSLVAFGLIFAGLVCLLAISYAAFRPIIGFFVMLALLACAGIIQFIALNIFNNKIKDNELFYDEKATYLEPANMVKYKYTFIVFFACFAVFVFSLPLFLIRESGYVLSLKYYFIISPAFICAILIGYFIAKRIFESITAKNNLDKKIAIITICTELTGIISLLFIAPSFCLRAVYSGYSDKYLNTIRFGITSFWIIAALYFAGLTAILIAVKNRPLKRKITLSLLRNFIYIVLLTVHAIILEETIEVIYENYYIGRRHGYLSVSASFICLILLSLATFWNLRLLKRWQKTAIPTIKV